MNTLTTARPADAEALADWTEPNWVAVNYEPVSEAVRGAFAGPVPDYPADTPLVRYASGEPARALLDVLAEAPPVERGVTCDLCGLRTSDLTALWVPTGPRSVTEVALCNPDFALLLTEVGSGLNVW